MTNVKVNKARRKRISQGDIFRNVDCIEYVAQKRGILEVSKITFPLVVVLTQDCDLVQDARYRNNNADRVPQDQDKKLFSVLVAPMYNAEQVFAGQHLSELERRMTQINRKRVAGPDVDTK